MSGAMRGVGRGAGEGPTEAWVIFTDAATRHPGLWWLRLLKPGFRHCLALLGGAAHWVIVDPTAARTEIGVWPREQAPDLPQRLAAAGFTLQPARLHPDAATPAGWRPFTCVEAVKRLIGLRAPWVLTPWALYRHLSRNAVL